MVYYINLQIINNYRAIDTLKAANTHDFFACSMTFVTHKAYKITI